MNLEIRRKSSRDYQPQHGETGRKFRPLVHQVNPAGC